MKQRSILWQAAGFAAVTLGGTILHFLYGWTGGSVLIAPFSGVNESTWEHMKLLFWPLFLFALVQRLFFKDQKNYWCVKLAEILLPAKESTVVSLSHLTGMIQAVYAGRVVICTAINKEKSFRALPDVIEYGQRK